MTERPRVLLGFDFTGDNYPSSLYTLQQWAAFAKQSVRFELIFGATTGTHREESFASTPRMTPSDAVRIMLQYGSPLFYWDEYVNAKAAKVLQEKGITCHASYPGFNYGNLVNRLLLLANELSCKYLVRVDPGTRPPSSTDFDNIVHEHVQFIHSSSRVVSRGYEGRLAIRDLFVRDREAHVVLVREFTGIEPTDQVTGGAMFTSNVPGTPAIPFKMYGTELTRVWGSDDAIFQVLASTQGSRKLLDSPIPRFDPEGRMLRTVPYYRGVAGMVYLANLINGNHMRAETRVTDFLNELRAEHLDPTKYRAESDGGNIDSEFVRKRVAPNAFLTRIREGWDNYGDLRARWPDIARALQGCLAHDVRIT